MDELRGWSRRRADDAAARSQARQVRDAGIRACASLEEAVREAAAVVAAVPAGAALKVAAAAAPHLRPGALYVDPSPLRPADKAAAAALVAAEGGRYADAAVLGTVAVDGAAVPTLVAGPGAEAWRALAAPLGLNVTVLPGPPGQAARVKLLRSVYMKGRDALLIEMLLAARAHGLERTVAQSIGGAGERVPFPQLADRVVRALALHAERRADELAAAAELLREAGVEPIVSDAGERRLRWVAGHDLRRRFGGERPGDPAQVLDALQTERRPERPSGGA